MSNPYLIEGPALISFSGGRTSGRMLSGIAQAHGGALPDDVVVGFANTGREKAETLRFVQDCAERWGVRVYMVEWRPTPAEAERIVALSGEGKATPEIAAWALEQACEGGFAVVGSNSLSRAGEPFEALIALKQRLPNGQERWCTEFLKVRPLFALMRSLGHGEPGAYVEAIGLRHDEGHRILKGLARGEKEGRRVTYPLTKARVTKRDVKAFWWGSEDARYESSTRPRGFDLELPSLWGNCDLCFAMGVAIREERARMDPTVPPWWAAVERRTGGTFSKRESVADVIRTAEARRAMGDLFAAPEITEADLDDAECGTWCAPDEQEAA